MYFGLQDLERGALTRAALATVSRIGKDRMLEIGEALADCFDTWKHGQADAKGMVRPKGPRLGLLAHALTTPKPVDEVKAWECAGPPTSDYIGLGYDLWLSGETGFKGLLERYGLAEVFSVLTLVDLENASATSLIRVNGMLTDLMIGEMDFLRESVTLWKETSEQLAKVADRRGKGLKRGPSEAARKSRERAQANFAMLLERYGPRFLEKHPPKLKALAGQIERDLTNRNDPLHGVYSFSTLRDDVLPRVKEAVVRKAYASGGRLEK